MSSHLISLQAALDLVRMGRGPFEINQIGATVCAPSTPNCHCELLAALEVAKNSPHTFQCGHARRNPALTRPQMAGWDW